MKKKTQKMIEKNAEILTACRAAVIIPGTIADSASVQRNAALLFHTIVPSAAQREASKRAVDMVRAALKVLDSKPPPVMHSASGVIPSAFAPFVASEKPPWGTAGPGTCSYCGGVGIVQHCRVRDDSRLLCTLCAQKLEAGTLKEDGYMSDAGLPQPERRGTCALCNEVKEVDVYARSFMGDLREVLLCGTCFAVYSEYVDKRAEKEMEAMRKASSHVEPSTSEEAKTEEEVDPPAPSVEVETDEARQTFVWQLLPADEACFGCGRYEKKGVLIASVLQGRVIVLCVDCVDAIEKSRKGSDD